MAAAEVFAASEAIDDEKVLKTAVARLRRMNVRLVVAVDSKDQYTSLSTQQNAVDRSI